MNKIKKFEEYSIISEDLVKPEFTPTKYNSTKLLHDIMFWLRAIMKNDSYTCSLEEFFKANPIIDKNQFLTLVSEFDKIENKEHLNITLNGNELTFSKVASPKKKMWEDVLTFEEFNSQPN